MSQDPTQTTNLAGGLDSRDQRTLARIYQHPLTHNLELRDATRLFNAIGLAEIQHNGEIGLHVGRETLTLVRPHGKDLTSDEVIKLRHFLDRTGWSPTAPVTELHLDNTPPDFVVIIDHASARIHNLESDDEPHHLEHEIDDSQEQDANREETHPADQKFFGDIADLIADAKRIVIISHGTGQSNEGEHLAAWLQSHRKPISDCIAHRIVADLPHTTEPELLAMAKLALAGNASGAREI